MEFCLITFRSVTPAQRAEALLRKGQIRCTLKRTPLWLQEKGCGYSIRLPLSQVHAAAALLDQGRIPFQKIYYLPDKGKAEEVVL